MYKGKILALAAAVTVALSAGASWADGDADAGEKVFKKCKACHTTEQGGKNKVGPNLFGVVGRKSGSIEGFKYSKAMSEADVTWTDENLHKYLTKPKDFVPKNKMAFAGLKKDKDRDDVIAYLKTLK
ncbi:MAG: cytochrome c family protein [Hyphomicrobiales bacterium]|nr:cytochrome c family protein [Hyphomicrobiales bacterium]MCP5371167.1 cytochrome c family protein [Hyphomicrobiales bacterium]